MAACLHLPQWLNPLGAEPVSVKTPSVGPGWVPGFSSDVRKFIGLSGVECAVCMCITYMYTSMCARECTRGRQELMSDVFLSLSLHLLFGAGSLPDAGAYRWVLSLGSKVDFRGRTEWSTQAGRPEFCSSASPIALSVTAQHTFVP